MPASILDNFSKHITFYVFVQHGLYFNQAKYLQLFWPKSGSNTFVPGHPGPGAWQALPYLPASLCFYELRDQIWFYLLRVFLYHLAHPSSGPLNFLKAVCYLCHNMSH